MTEVVINSSSATAWRRGYDSADPRAIPLALAAGAVVLGYPDFGWTPDDFARYKAPAGATTVRITQRAPADWQSCSVLDWQPGAIFDPVQLRDGVIHREQFRPGTATVYSDESNLWEMGRALHGLSYWVWVAAWPQFPTPDEIAAIRRMLRPGARLAGIQYRNLALEDYDESVFIDPAWHPAK